MFEKRTHLFNKTAFNWSKLTVKSFTFRVKSFFMLFVCLCCAFPFFRILKKSFMISTKIWSSRTISKLIIIIRNAFWAANQHIRMISEGSCDTEDWSNDAENSALHYRNKLHLTIYYNRKQLFYIVIIFQNITVVAVLNKRSLGEQKRHFEQ